MARRDRVLALARATLRVEERTSYSSEDAFSSVLRRLDGMAENGSLRATSDAEIEALIATVTRNLLATRQRLLHLAHTHRDDAFWAQIGERLSSGADPHGTELVRFLVECVDSEEDRVLLFGQLHGLSHRVLARELGIGEDAVRKRWQRLRARLATVLEEGDGARG